MLIHILRFEWRYHTRHLTFAAAAAGPCAACSRGPRVRRPRSTCSRRSTA